MGRTSEWKIFVYEVWGKNWKFLKICLCIWSFHFRSSIDDVVTIYSCICDIAASPKILIMTILVISCDPVAQSGHVTVVGPISRNQSTADLFISSTVELPHIAMVIENVEDDNDKEQKG